MIVHRCCVGGRRPTLFARPVVAIGFFALVTSSQVHRISAFTLKTATRTTTTARQQQSITRPPPPLVSQMSKTTTTDSNDGDDGDDTMMDPLVELDLPRPLILGSGSFTRKLILKEMGISFKVIKRPIDEKSIGDRLRDAPEELVVTLAQAKCDHLVSELQKGALDKELPAQDSDQDGWIVLTGDQVVVVQSSTTTLDETNNGDDEKKKKKKKLSILEKPESVEEAKKMVCGYAQNPPQTVGSCVLTHVPSGVQVRGVDTATIHFRPTVADGDGQLIDRLLQDNAPVLDCAGGLMVEHPLVQKHLERIDGTQDSVMGLSKDLVLRLLHELKDKLS